MTEEGTERWDREGEEGVAELVEQGEMPGEKSWK